MTLVRQGLTDREIAMRFGISRQAVSHHRCKAGLKRDEVARLRQIIAGQKFASAQRDYEPPSHCIGPHRAPGVSVAPAGAWETALAGRRFQNVPLIVRLHERSGQLPSRIVKTGNSSMAWVA